MRNKEIKTADLAANLDAESLEKASFKSLYNVLIKSLSNLSIVQFKTHLPSEKFSKSETLEQWDR
jgi:hypothetical protein